MPSGRLTALAEHGTALLARMRGGRSSSRSADSLGSSRTSTTSRSHGAAAAADAQLLSGRMRGIATRRSPSASSIRRRASRRKPARAPVRAVAAGTAPPHDIRLRALGLTRSGRDRQELPAARLSGRRRLQAPADPRRRRSPHREARRLLRALQPGARPAGRALVDCAGVPRRRRRDKALASTAMPEVLVINGPCGAGKSTVGFECLEILEERDVPAAMVDAESSTIRSGSGRGRRRARARRGLADLPRRGTDRLLLPRVIEKQRHLEACSAPCRCAHPDRVARGLPRGDRAGRARAGPRRSGISTAPRRSGATPATTSPTSPRRRLRGAHDALDLLDRAGGFRTR
jgi:hypothetical protein